VPPLGRIVAGKDFSVMKGKRSPGMRLTGRRRADLSANSELSRLELTAGARRYTPEAAGIWHANHAVRQAERELAQQAGAV
jgi:hypothetical protein